MEVTLRSVDIQEKTGHSILVMEKVCLSKAEIYSLKYGNVFACVRSRDSATVEGVLLAAVMPQSREEMEKSNSFALMVFKPVAKATKETWRLTSLASLLSEQRKFDACVELIRKPFPILSPVLGKKRATHLRFHEDEEGKTVAVEAEDVESDSDCEILEVIDVESAFHLPRLNHSQEAAAKAFLASSPGEITLIQGPPGTGKTTLLTSVIGRYVVESQKMEHRKRTLLVCAPTNKAITVLCKRFLNSFIDDESAPCNAVLVGDEDNIFNDEKQQRQSTPSRLRRIFLYSFIHAVRDDYLYIQRTLMRNRSLHTSMLSKLQKIARRLNNRLARNTSDTAVIISSGKILELVGKISATRANSQELLEEVNLILCLIDQWDHSSVWREILRRADVIFCTLASSGSSFLRKSIVQVDDLIVDEAAASTEPEIYIPFLYNPSRVLAVGDPKQLPATVASVTAERLGLSKSLHERLMYNCDFPHIMLDTQYRMKPAIAQFPSNHFYSRKLKNGRNVTRASYTNGIMVINNLPYTMFQVSGVERQGRTGSFENMEEAHAVVEIISAFRSLASQKYGRDWCSSDRLRVITFYQAQVALVSRLLRQKGMGNVLVATVDSSQGCEADHVIVSFVRSEGHHGRSSVGFLADERRLNVGLTRAKYQLICVGNIERMCHLSDSKAEVVRRLALDAKQRKCIVPFDSGKVGILASSRKREHDGYKNVKPLKPPKRKAELGTHCHYGQGRHVDTEEENVSESNASSTTSSGGESVSSDSDSSSSIPSNAATDEVATATHFNAVPQRNGATLDQCTEQATSSDELLVDCKDDTSAAARQEMHDASTQYDGLMSTVAFERSLKPDPPAQRNADEAGAVLSLDTAHAQDALVVVESSPSGQSDVEEAIVQEKEGKPAPVRPDPPVSSHSQPSILYEDFWC
ncbi:MAG: hypothetical protein SGILL_003261 [Bacillariaceae sp.]